jgi:hypothetical protein
MERREPVERVGKRWHSRAAGGRDGMGREAVCEEVMVVPSGRITDRGLEAGWISVTGPVTWM